MYESEVSFSQAVEGYFLAANARRLSPHTLAGYDNAFRKFEVFLGGDPPLSEVTAQDVRRFLAGEDGVMAKTRRSYHIALSALWTWAGKEGLTERHVMREVERPKPEQREVMPLTEEDVKAMLAMCERSRRYARPGKRACTNVRPTARRDRAIMLVLLDTGIRVSELCGLRLKDVDLKNQRILVMGKGARERMVPISSRTAQAVWRHLASRGDAERPGAFVFLSTKGEPIKRRTVLQVLKRIGDRAGVPGVTVHRFRHTFAIAFLRNGGSAFVLQRMLGHSTLDMVRRYLAIADADVEIVHRRASPVDNWLL